MSLRRQTIACWTIMILTIALILSGYVFDYKILPTRTPVVVDESE